MIKAAEYALSGLNNAGRQFESAARSIAGDPSINQAHDTISRASGNADAGLDTNAGSDQSGKPPSALLNAEGAAVTQSQQEAPSLAEGLVSLKEAEVSYKANAAVIGALQDTQDRVLEILA